MGATSQYGAGLLRLDEALELVHSATPVHGTTTTIQTPTFKESRTQEFKNIQLAAASIPPPPSFMGETYVTTWVELYEFTSTVTLSNPTDVWVRGRESFAARDTTQYDGYFEPYVGNAELNGNVATLRGYTYKVFNSTGTQFWGWYPLKVPLSPGSSFPVFSYTYLSSPAPAWLPADGLLVTSSAIIPVRDHGVSVDFNGGDWQRGRLTIVDVRGRIVSQVDVPPGSGNRSVSWSGKDAAGIRVPAGIYFGKLEVGNEMATVRLLAIE